MIVKPFYTFLLLIIILVCFNCKKSNEKTAILKETVILDTILSIKNSQDSVLKKWISFYNKFDKNFSLEKFKFDTSDTLYTHRGMANGNYNEYFEKKFEKLLIYNSKKTEYIDIDTYYIVLDDNGTVMFDVDQEINWVKIKEKKVSRVSYKGPLESVNDVFWHNDSIIILLENNEKTLSIKEINLNSRKIKKFNYPDTINTNTSYTFTRLTERGFIIK